LAITLIIVMLIIRHIQVIHHIILRTHICTKMRKAFMKQQIRMNVIKICETLETVKGKF
jgi:hypothetical protein